MAKGDDLQERLIDFTVRIIKLCSELPKTRREIILNGSVSAPRRNPITGLFLFVCLMSEHPSDCN